MIIQRLAGTSVELSVTRTVGFVSDRWRIIKGFIVPADPVGLLLQSSHVPLPPPHCALGMNMPSTQLMVPLPQLEGLLAQSSRFLSFSCDGFPFVHVCDVVAPSAGVCYSCKMQ